MSGNQVSHILESPRMFFVKFKPLKVLENSDCL